MTEIMIPLAPDVAHELWSTRRSDSESWDTLVRHLLGDADRTSRRVAAQRQPHQVQTSVVVYRFLGEPRVASSAIDLLVDVLRSLADLDPTFLPSLAKRVRGRSRNHLARAPQLVYPDRPDLARTARPIAQGWFLGTNLANRDKLLIIETACDVAGLEYGRDVVVNFGDRLGDASADVPPALG